MLRKFKFLFLFPDQILPIYEDWKITILQQQATLGRIMQPRCIQESPVCNLPNLARPAHLSYQNKNYSGGMEKSCSILWYTLYGTHSLLSIFFLTIQLFSIPLCNLDSCSYAFLPHPQYSGPGVWCCFRIDMCQSFCHFLLFFLFL